MMIFFNEIFRRLYNWNQYLDKSFSKLIPIKSDALFSAIWGVSFFQAFNLFVIYSNIAFVLDIQELLFRVDYVLYFSMGICLVPNYLYYNRGEKYKRIISRKLIKKNPSYVFYLYYIFTVGLALVTLFFVYGPKDHSL